MHRCVTRCTEPHTLTAEWDFYPGGLSAFPLSTTTGPHLSDGSVYRISALLICIGQLQVMRLDEVKTPGSKFICRVLRHTLTEWDLRT